MILFVEDEPFYTESFREEFEDQGYKIELKRSVEEAWVFLEQNGAGVEFLLLDVMMRDPGLAGSAGSKDFMRTGVRFFERVRARFPTLPIGVFTNVSDENVEKFFAEQAYCWFLPKTDYLPDELVERVKELLAQSAARMEA